MKRTAFLAMMSTFLLLMATSAQGQPNFGQFNANDYYANSPNPLDQFSGNQNQYPDQNSYMSNAGLQANAGYSSSVPSGAPTPLTPSSPDSLGLQIPTESASTAASYVSSSGALTPPPEEASQALIPANFATAGKLTDSLQSWQNNYPSQSDMVVSQETKAKNKLYVSLVPQTVAGCGLYGWQPMWLQTSSSGPLWFYEWYPNGRLSVNYLGISSAGWQKKWFNGDTPGWHILQYYSRGWSNYIYIYVYGGSGYLASSKPYSGAVTPKPSYSGTSTVTLRSSWFDGYNVYLDGTYIGTEGFGSDLLDGVYNFRVPGGMRHTIVISKNGESYEETGTFVSGTSYRFTI
jgi:hypothetical protein